MRKFITLFIISSLLAINSFAETTPLNTDPAKKNEDKSLKLSIDLGNITYTSKKDINDKIKNYTRKFLSDTTVNNYNLMIKASVDNKTVKACKFELSAKGSLAEIRKEMETTPDVIDEIKKEFSNFNYLTAPSN